MFYLVGFNKLSVDIHFHYTERGSELFPLIIFGRLIN